MGVEIQLGAMVTDVDRNGITVKDSDGTDRRIECGLQGVVGRRVRPARWASDLAEQSGAEARPRRPGQGAARPDRPRPPERVRRRRHDGGRRRARHGAGRDPGRQVRGEGDQGRTRRAPTRPQREPFHYFDKGSMATVSRFSAVAKIGKLEFGGFIAWLAWLVLHLVYLVGFKTKITTLLSWTVTFLRTRRGKLDHHRAAGLRPNASRTTGRAGR